MSTFTPLHLLSTHNIFDSVFTVIFLIPVFFDWIYSIPIFTEENTVTFIAMLFYIEHYILEWWKETWTMDNGALAKKKKLRTSSLMYHSSSLQCLEQKKSFSCRQKLRGCVCFVHSVTNNEAHIYQSVRVVCCGQEEPWQNRQIAGVIAESCDVRVCPVWSHMHTRTHTSGSPKWKYWGVR